MSGSDFAAAAARHLGTPFGHGQATAGVAVDCVGLLLVAARDLGLTDYAPANYSRLVSPARLRAEIERFCDVGPPPIQAGDVLLLTVRGVARHLGVAEEGGTFLHAVEWARGEGRVLRSRLADAAEPGRTWEESVVALYRWRGIV